MATEYTQRTIELRLKLQDEMIHHYIWQSCLNCEHFESKSEACKISNNQRPPAHIIVSGCPKHDFDIPF